MKVFNTLIISLLFFVTYSLNSQQRIIINNNVDSETFDFFIGTHTGIFDSNQHGIAYNIGVLSKYHYIPFESGRWFVGSELGMFYAASKTDYLNRTTKLGLFDISVYPGYAIPFGTNIKSEDNNLKRYKKLASSRKLRFGLGFTVSIPIFKRSEGGGVNLDQIKPYFGLSLKSSLDLPNRISLFGTVTRIGKDMDGLAFKSDSSTERSNGNNHDVTYYFKLGILWNFVRR